MSNFRTILSRPQRIGDNLIDILANQPTILPIFTTSTLPSPFPAGQLIYLSDVNQIAVSDGTAWDYSTVSPSNEALYSDALINNAANFAAANNTFGWSPAFQLNVTGGATPGQTNAPSGAGSLPFSPAVVITAPIYYEVTYVSSTPPAPVPPTLQIAAGGAVTAGAYTPGADYAFAITMEPGTGSIIAQLGPQPVGPPFLIETIEGPGLSLGAGTTLGVWIDIPNNNVNYTYDGTLHTTDSVTGTNPLMFPADFDNGAAGAVTTSNLFSGSGVVLGATGDMVSVKINIGQDPFVHNPQLMAGTVDWFGNPL